MGLEPTWKYIRGILSPLRLPIPPYLLGRLVSSAYNTVRVSRILVMWKYPIMHASNTSDTHVRHCSSIFISLNLIEPDRMPSLHLRWSDDVLIKLQVSIFQLGVFYQKSGSDTFSLILPISSLKHNYELDAYNIYPILVYYSRWIS